MGWSSGTRIFDAICHILLSPAYLTKQAQLEAIIEVLEDEDWDGQNESTYWEHPIVSRAFKRIHPEWFEN